MCFETIHTGIKNLNQLCVLKYPMHVCVCVCKEHLGLSNEMCKTNLMTLLINNGNMF